MQLNHLHLHVRDVDRSQRFYAKWFGFREHARHGPIPFLRDKADLDLALAPDDEPQPFPNWFHFGFRLDSAQAVRDLHDAMTEAGVSIVQAVQTWEDLVVFRCADPDGTNIEIYWE